jgi:hypothetical protein
MADVLLRWRTTSPAASPTSSGGTASSASGRRSTSSPVVWTMCTKLYTITVLYCTVRLLCISLGNRKTPVRLLCISLGNRKTLSLFMQNDQRHLVLAGGGAWAPLP